MKIACGVDIVEIYRVKKAIEDNQERFLGKVFTQKEIDYCESHGDNKYQHYAARFAAKEATFKAVSQIIGLEFLDWKSFKISNNTNGKPEISIKNDRIKSLDISISHCKEYAVANVVVLYE